MKISDIVDQVNQTGHSLDIEFAAKQDRVYGIEDLETYAVPGMRARITGGTNEHDDTAILFVDYEPFEEHNRPFETVDFWHDDHNGHRVLTDARTAGKYITKDKLFLPGSLSSEQLFAVLDAPTSDLVEAWRAIGKGGSYVDFLEGQVLKLQALQQADEEKTAPQKGSHDRVVADKNVSAARGRAPK